MRLCSPLVRCPAPSRQTGAILVISLLLLVVMTTIALGASQMTRAQSGSATTLQERMLMFQAAEAALAAGERVVGDPSLTSPPLPCKTGRCRIYASNALHIPATQRTADWWELHGWGFSQRDLPRRPAGGTWFVIEEYSNAAGDGSIAPSNSVPRRVYYRVTAASLGSGTGKIVLQSIVARQFAANPDDPSLGKSMPLISRRQSWRQLL